MVDPSQRRGTGGPGGGWAAYLRRFHEANPGITEDVLAHATDQGATPYGWVVDAVGAGPVLDLACGSGPLAPALAGRGWVGVDSSASELANVRQHGTGRVALADAVSVPLPDGVVGTVVCSMALMLVDPVDAALAEVARVLRPGGTFVALLPSTRPRTASDTAHYARLLAVLRRRHLAYPNDDRLVDATGLMGAHSLRLVEDERRRFACRITSPAVGVMCVRSLYLPDVDPGRLAAGEHLARGWVGKELGLPLRRLVAVREGAGEGTQAGEVSPGSRSRP